jgi:hypothetical protein
VGLVRLEEMWRWRRADEGGGWRVDREGIFRIGVDYGKEVLFWFWF